MHMGNLAQRQIDRLIDISYKSDLRIAVRGDVVPAIGLQLMWFMIFVSNSNVAVSNTDF